MKKQLILFLVLLLSFFLVACQETTSTTTTTTEVTTELTTTLPQTISAIVGSLENENNIGLFLTETPYSSMGINFELSTNTLGFVEYGLKDSGEYTRLEATQKITVVNNKTVYLYEAVMDDLISAQTYSYRITNNDDSETSAYHEFSMPDSEAESFTFMYLADPQENAETGYMAYAYSILNVLDFSQQNYDFVVFPGDVINDADVQSQWNLFFKYSSVFSYEKPLIATTGNHDSGAITEDRINSLEFDGYMNLPNNGPIYEEFNEIDGDLRTSHFDDGKTYSFDYGTAHFVVIDTEIYCDGTTACITYDESNADILNEWVRNDLTNNNQLWTIVLLHRGPYSLSYDTDSVRDNLVPIFDEFGVDLVLAGHDHQYSRAVYQNLELIQFKRSNEYFKGTISLIEALEEDCHFNNYTSALGVTYLTANTSGTKYYGGDKSSGIDVNYKFIEENPVIPMITVTNEYIQVISYGLEKDTGLSIVPTGVYVLEEFMISRPAN
ncbi:MAG: metallophosphoesterase family protein [Firmicutes bacterium]|nr:metallophosphoesterase family protein [Bacillota bacterium]